MGRIGTLKDMFYDHFGKSVMYKKITNKFPMEKVFDKEKLSKYAGAFALASVVVTAGLLFGNLNRK